jgi:hypothetical protein
LQGGTVSPLSLGRRHGVSEWDSLGGRHTASLVSGKFSTVLEIFPCGNAMPHECFSRAIGLTRQVFCSTLEKLAGPIPLGSTPLIRNSV